MIELEDRKGEELCKINVKTAKPLLYELLFWEVGLLVVKLHSGKLMWGQLMFGLDVAGCYCQ